LPVNLNSASTYAVLAFSDVTNSGATSLCGNLGVWSGTAWGVGSGYLFGCGGVVHATDTPAQVAQGDLTTAYDDAMGRTLNPIPENNADLGGLTLAPGLYKSTGTLAITGNLKLDGGGDPNSVWIFQVQTSMTTAVSSTITLAGSAKASNIFWQVGTSATLGGTSTFEGTLMAGTLIAFGTGIDLEGRALSLGEVTLLTDIVNAQAP
jgi:hypothetical protein